MNRHSFVSLVLLVLFSLVQLSWGQSNFFRKRAAAGNSGSVLQSNDGSYLFAGMVPSQDSPGLDLLLMKLNSAGKVQWKKRFAGSHVSLSNPQIAELKDGTFLLAASSYEDSLDSDIVIIRVANSGKVLWSEVLDSGSFESVSAIANTFEGGAVITGDLISRDGQSLGIYVAQIDRSGKIQWTRMDAGAKISTGIAQTNDGGYVVASGFVDENDQSIQARLQKLNPRGQALWRKNIRGFWNTDTGRVAVTAKGVVVMSGTAVDEASEISDGFLMAFNSSGTPLWQKTYRVRDENGGNFSSSISNVAATADGVLIAGGSNSTICCDSLSFIMKLHANGKIIWEKGIDAISGAEDVILQATLDGGGVSTFRGLEIDEDQDISVLKVDRSGKIPACVAHFAIGHFASKGRLSVENGKKINVTLPLTVSSFPLKVSNWSFAFPDACQ